jgi:hypothetical protein
MAENLEAFAGIDSDEEVAREQGELDSYLTAIPPTVHGLVQGKESLNAAHPQILMDAFFMSRISLQRIPAGKRGLKLLAASVASSASTGLL